MQETEVLVAIDGEDAHVVEHVREVEHRHNLDDLVEVEWGDDHRDEVEHVEQQTVVWWYGGGRRDGCGRWDAVVRCRPFVLLLRLGHHGVCYQCRDAEDGHPQHHAVLEMVAEGVEQSVLSLIHQQDGEPYRHGDSPWGKHIAYLQSEKDDEQQAQHYDHCYLHGLLRYCVMALLRYGVVGLWRYGVIGLLRDGVVAF